MYQKCRYDGEKFSYATALDISETGKIYLLKYLEKPLTIEDMCELKVTKDNQNIILRDCPKNLNTDFGGDFETGTYFVYELSKSEIEYLGKGRFVITLRLYSPNSSIMAFEEQLLIK